MPSQVKNFLKFGSQIIQKYEKAKRLKSSLKMIPQLCIRSTRMYKKTKEILINYKKMGKRRIVRETILEGLGFWKEKKTCTEGDGLQIFFCSYYTKGCSSCFRLHQVSLAIKSATFIYGTN